jgi:predicted DNA-binding transcriptional regulator YafY
MKIDRLLAITVLLNQKGRLSAGELSRHFEVSHRTILRDIDSLNMAGIPVVSYKGYGGGFEILDNYKLEGSLFDKENLSSIITALEGLGTAFSDKEINKTLDKVKLLLPEDERKKLDSSLSVDFSPWFFSKSFKSKTDIIKESIQNRNLIEFSYINRKLIKKIRTVEPMKLFFKDRSWYLFSFCRDKNDYRFFKLSRMNGIKKLDKTFIKREKNIEDFDKIENWETTKSVHLKLKFHPDADIDDYFKNQIMSFDSKGYSIVEIIMPDDIWLYGFLLGFGDMMEVLEPESVRLLIKNKIKNLYSIYKCDS